MKFNFEATGVGSVPFANAKEACRIIFDNFQSIPFWPQLSKRSFLENMYAQFSEKIPGLVIDEKNKNIYVDTSDIASRIEEVYEKYLEGDLDFFALSENYARGFYEFLECLKAPQSKNIKFVKGQVIGPISYALFLTDQNKKAIIYDKDIFEVLTKILVMKARWQIKKLKKYFPNTIIFIDEPYLVSIGSSFVNINIEAAFERFDELVKAIKGEGSLVGAHCCGNTDFGLLLKRDIDILNFDAYNFTKEFALYSGDIKNYLKDGKAIAWGMIPSSDAIEKENKRTLADRFRSNLGLLANKGIDTKNISSLITPSCGVGTLNEDTAKKVIEAARTLSADLQI